MGVSTDAILFYGYAWTEEERIWDVLSKPEYLAEMDFDERYEKYEDPRGDFIQLCYEVQGREQPKTWRDDNWDNFSPEEKSEARAAQKKADKEVSCGTEMGIHCSYSYPLLYLAVSESEVSASRGYPEEVSSRVGSDTSEWDLRLAQIVETMGIQVDGKPGWHVASFWGE